MATYEITAPNGAKYRVTAPDTATQDEVLSRVKAQSVADDMSNTSWGQVATSAVQNIPGSAVEFAKNTAQPFIHPIDTATSIGNLDVGIAQKADKAGLLESVPFVGAARSVMRMMGISDIGSDKEKYADTLAKFFKDRYGSIAALKKTISTDPVGVLADASVVLTGGGDLAERAPGILGQTARAAANVGRTIDPVNLAVKSVKTAANLRSGAVGDRDILRALQRDQMTPQFAMEAGAQVAQERPGMATLADVGGENVQGLVERVSQTPGAGRTDLIPNLKARQEQSLDRISTDLRELTGTKQSAFKAIAQTIAERKQDAAPLYNAAYEAGDRAIWSNELERLSSAPEVQQAMRQAVAGWQRNQIANGYGAMNPGAKVDQGLLKITGGKIPVFPNLQFWDYVKGSLDDMARGAITREGATRKGRDLSIISQKLRDELDKQVPQYAAARRSWAGPAAYIDAINEGKEVLSRNVSSDEISAKMANFDSEAERQGYRTGVVSSILVRLANNPTALADLTRELRSPEMRKKIAAIMPTPDLAKKWNTRLDLEVKSSELVGRALKGSPTARRLAEMQDASVVGDLVKDGLLSAGRPTHLALKIVSTIPKFVRDTMRSKADQRIARVLTSPGALQRLPLILGQQGRGLAALRSAPLLGEGAGTVGPTLGRSAFQIGRLGNASQ